MKPKLTINNLIKEAHTFCKLYSGVYRPELFGITDGKAIGTLVEHEFQNFLADKYDLVAGNSAIGLDLPSVETDIKVTSIVLPQSSCPFKDSKQKIFGLGYNLLVFIYRKTDDVATKKGMLEFVSCNFIDKTRTADFQTTIGIHNVIKNSGNIDDIFAFLSDRHIPADDVSLYQMAEDILSTPPEIGYLTISNALQWRLQYSRIINLTEEIPGVIAIYNK